MAKDAYWFRHDANARYDIKVIELRSLHGYEGYGIYFAILEVMREQEGYCIPESKVGMVGVALGESSQKVRVIIEDCVKIGLFEQEDGIIYSRSFLDRMAKWESVKTRNETNGAKGGRPKAEPKKNPSETQTKARRGEERIEEEKRGENTLPGYSPEFESLWTAYDRKGSKKAAYAQWRKLSAQDRDTASAHVPGYVSATERRYRKDLERYLRDGTYEGKVVAATNGKPDKFAGIDKSQYLPTEEDLDRIFPR